MTGICELVVLLTSLEDALLRSSLRFAESQCNCVLRFQGLDQRSIRLVS
jgi:hypothetical protein